eukprot:1793359-Karenia_brevis.AAC.1
MPSAYTCLVFPPMLLLLSSHWHFFRLCVKHNAMGWVSPAVSQLCSIAVHQSLQEPRLALH